MDDAQNIVGAAHDKIQHDSAVKHVTGKALYIDDMPSLPNTLQIVLVTSPLAHANIKSIDGKSFDKFYYRRTIRSQNIK